METRDSQPGKAHGKGHLKAWLLRGGLVGGAAVLALGCYLWVLVAGLTEPQPRHIPLEPLPRPEADALEDRVFAFQQALRQQTPTPPLSLTTSEMNGLIAIHPGLRAARGRLRFNLDQEFPEVTVSARLAELHLPAFRDRYFNGTITFSLAMKDGLLVIRAKELRSSNRTVPGLIMAYLHRYNLAAPVNEDARFALTLENVRGVEVKHGRVVITAKNSTL